MNQGEQFIAAIGNGAAIIYECSNNYIRERIPRLTIIMPGEIGRVINPGDSDQAVHDFPARSFEITGSRVRELHEALCKYYGEPTHGNEELLEACRKASTCASIPDSVMDVIRSAIAKATGRYP